MNDFILGALLFPGAMVVVTLMMLMLIGASRLWTKYHAAVSAKYQLRPDPIKTADLFSGKRGPDTYTRGANKVRDALLRSPKYFTIFGLGWIVVFVRDTAPESSAAPDTDRYDAGEFSTH